MRLSRALNEAQSYEDIIKILDKPDNETEAKISFFGSYRFSVKGYSFSYSIDSLVDKIKEMVKNNPEFSREERTQGRTIVAKIDYLYSEIERQEKEVNCITKLFLWIIGNLEGNLMITFWEQYENQLFEYYTKKQFIEEFAIEPQGEPDDRGGNGIPDKWKAP